MSPRDGLRRALLRAAPGDDRFLLLEDPLAAWVAESPREGPTFNEEVDFETGLENVIEGTDDQFILAHRVNAHVSRVPSVLPFAMAACSCPNDHYTLAARACLRA